MKKGDYVGISDDKGKGDSWLWCRVEETNDKKTRFWVVNGAWYLDHMADGDWIIRCPSGDSKRNHFKVSWTHPIPDIDYNHYNAAIEYMRKHHNDSKLKLKLLTKIAEVRKVVNRYTAAFKAAKRTFDYKLGKKTKPVSILDDDIAF